MFAEIFSYDQELREEARVEKAIEIAKSLLESGMPLADIVKHSKLSIDVIQNLD